MKRGEMDANRGSRWGGSRCIDGCIGHARGGDNRELTNSIRIARAVRTRAAAWPEADNRAVHAAAAWIGQHLADAVDRPERALMPEIEAGVLGDFIIVAPVADVAEEGVQIWERACDHRRPGRQLRVRVRGDQRRAAPHPDSAQRLAAVIES
jgi:hypothetical protein